MKTSDSLGPLGRPVARGTGHRRIPEATARSYVVLPALLGPNIQKRFPTAISDVTPSLNSGSGVFDAGQKCLLGIISRKITVRPNSGAPESEQKDIAKYFVPAGPSYYRIASRGDVARSEASGAHHEASGAHHDGYRPDSFCRFTRRTSDLVVDGVCRRTTKAARAVSAVANRNPIDQHRVLWTSGRPVLTVTYRVSNKRIHGNRQLLDQNSVLAYGEFNVWRH
jgi:hypothetical protein